MGWGGYRNQIAKKKAIIVVAHAMLVIAWHVLVTGKPFHELGEDYFTNRRDPEREPAPARPRSLAGVRCRAPG
jgi:hypothetical protein